MTLLSMMTSMFTVFTILTVNADIAPCYTIAA